ncbi:MAG: TIGR02391 family protein [Pseudomonadota bacterium]
MSQQIFVKFCRNGHMTYAVDEEVQQSNCTRCGEPLHMNCEKCSAKIPNVFSGTYLSALKRLATYSIPNRPKFCGNCGQMYPWTQVIHEKIENSGIWLLLHPDVTQIARSRFDTGHYADAVEATFKHINNKIKKIYRTKTGQELDGVSLMRKAFTPSSPTILLDTLETDTGKNIQQGYMDIFAGSMSAIRNPKAHENIEISAERCAHFLVLGSLLISNPTTIHSKING